MGCILSSKSLSGNKVRLKILVDKSEALSLKNAILNINLLSDSLITEEAKIIKRGKEGVTKYFEIPFNLRTKNLNPYSELTSQKIEGHTKTYFIYVLKKRLL